MNRRFKSNCFLAVLIIGSLLLFSNLGQAYTIPNASFTNGLTGWTKSGEGTASIVTSGAPNGGNSVRLSLGADEPYVLLTSTPFYMEVDETVSGWFKTETEGKWVEVYLARISPSGSVKSSNSSQQDWDDWSITAWYWPPSDGFYTLNFSVQPGSTGQFAIAPVPIPPSVWLLGSGLIGLVGLRRKFFRK